MLHGASAGDGLCLGVSLLYRDRNQPPPLFALVLFAPMVDDVNDSGSAHAFSGVGVWDRAVNGQGWDALLGSRRGTDDVSIYAAPIRATDFSGLPTMYVDVGSTETFRDENVLLVQKVWRDGVQCELHESYEDAVGLV
ncbi:hypothetical protein ASPWEDRAFT_181934 [Aspergillus wentii DTO 134E9]|uniref:Alpha/beta hydrolase fold-3 domain-containing protein n=1 Tax=Aspergillus wentii DTO 134E9 TaxID=1073089 RepID=A0A1L9RQ27_ASPWE|nr:uncharacterized protein ASPWEDRAFT_181934 [Aspergillus wentii DTO 134E9]OJJ37002.1 hypothetical protein ASPWEDRAFT_181934 [Aspergillus wentii DTO 134E9]